MEEKSANRLWRESGTTLSYKEWRNRENAKKQDTTLSFIGEQNVKDTLNNVFTSATSSTPPPQNNTSSVLGLNKIVLIVSGVVIASSLGYYFYKKLKK